MIDDATAASSDRIQIDPSRLPPGEYVFAIAVRNFLEVAFDMNSRETATALRVLPDDQLVPYVRLLGRLCRRYGNPVAFFCLRSMFFLYPAALPTPRALVQR